jgi:hypothetical protein
MYFAPRTAVAILVVYLSWALLDYLATEVADSYGLCVSVCRSTSSSAETEALCIAEFNMYKSHFLV